MTRNHAAMSRLIDRAAAEATKLLEAEARRMLRKCRSIDGFTNAMGSVAFYAKSDGMPMFDHELPAAARALERMAYEYQDAFGSSGISIYRSDL